MVVQHNMQAMNANRMLGITTGKQAKSTEKLSSGYRINRAADDAAGLTISEKMRKQIRGLDRASTNAQDGISCVQTAEGALTEVHSMLQRMNELAVQAANGTMSEDDRKATQDEIDQLVTEIDRVSETTKFNEIYLLKGDPATAKNEVKTTYSYELTDVAKAAEKGELSVIAGQDAYGAGKTAAVKGDTADAAASISFTDKGGGTSHLYVSPAGTWADTLEVTAANFETYFQVDDAGTVTAKNGTATFGVAASAAAAAGGAKTVTDLVNDGWVTGTAKSTASKGDLDQYIELDDDGNIKYKDGQMLYTDPANPGEYGDQLQATVIAEADLGNYFESSANPLTEADGTTKITDLSAHFEDGAYIGGIYRKDSNGNSVEIGAEEISKYVKVDSNEIASKSNENALEFKLHVGSESAPDNKISVKIESMSANGIGVDVLTGKGLMTQDDATAAIDTISDAIAKVSEQRSALGAIQNRLEHTIANLDNVVENTTAAESRIRDVDMAEEMVEYSKNNILAQAGQSMLAQANQSTQGVLSLLG